MAEAAEISILRKMAAAKKADLGLSVMSPQKALRLAFAKAGDDVLSTAVNVKDVETALAVPDDLGDGLPEVALFMRLNGPGDAVGLAIMCMQVVSAVIEAKTIGHVQHAIAADRKATRTDAILVGGMFDPALAAFGVLAAECQPSIPAAGFSCGPPLTDLRAAQMCLGDVVLRHFKIAVEFDGGAKSGAIHLLLPADHKADAGNSIAAKNWQGTLENAVLATSARMEAVLCNFKLSIAEIAQLKTGDMLPLRDASVDGVSLVGSDGKQVIKARLGRSGPVRAVRLFFDGAPHRPPELSGSVKPLKEPQAEMPLSAPSAEDLPVNVGLPDTGAAALPDAPAIDLVEPAAMPDVDLPMIDPAQASMDMAELPDLPPLG